MVNYYPAKDFLYEPSKPAKIFLLRSELDLYQIVVINSRIWCPWMNSCISLMGRTFRFRLCYCFLLRTSHKRRTYLTRTLKNFQILCKPQVQPNYRPTDLNFEEKQLSNNFFDTYKNWDKDTPVLL